MVFKTRLVVGKEVEVVMTVKPKLCALLISAPSLPSIGSCLLWLVCGHSERTADRMSGPSCASFQT